MAYFRFRALVPQRSASNHIPAGKNSPAQSTGIYHANATNILATFLGGKCDNGLGLKQKEPRCRYIELDGA